MKVRSAKRCDAASRRGGRRTRLLVVAAAAVVVPVFPDLLQATTGTWGGATSGNWSDTTKWVGGVVPNGVDDVMQFQQSGNSTVVVDIPVTLGTLSETVASTTNTVFLSASKTLTFQSSTGAASIAIQSGNQTNFQAGVALASNINITSTRAQITFSNPVSGSGSMTVGTNSLLFLNAANPTWSGALTINSGEVVAAKTNSLGTSSGTDTDGTFVGSGAQLFVQSGADTGTERIHLASGASIAGTGTVHGSVILDGSPTLIGGTFAGNISGPYDVNINGSVTLASANSYTGRTFITGGGTVLNDPGGLGTSPNGAAVSGGTLTLNVSGSEPIQLSGSGTVRLNTPTYAGPLTVYGGTIALGTAISTYSSPITLSGAASISPLAFDSLAGGISGRGDLLITSGFGIDSAITTNGMMRIGGSNVYLSVPTGPNTQVWINGINTNTAALTITKNLSLPNINIANGSLNTASGVALDIGSSDLTFDQANFNANLVGTGRLVKDGPDSAGMTTVGSYTGQMLVNCGILLSSGRTGVGAAGITVASREATLQFGTTQESISLNNAAGYDFAGALQDGTYAGPVSLTSGTSLVGDAAQGKLTTISGPLTGSGALQVIGNVVLKTPSPAYTGATIIGQGGVGSGLILDDATHLASTSQVVVNGGGNLSLSFDSTSTNFNRLNAAVPIVLQGGNFAAANANDAGAVAVNVGPLSLARGFSQLSVTAQYRDTDSMSVTAQSLSRSPGAMAMVSISAIGANSGAGSIKFATPPPVTNGIIGGWAMSRTFTQSVATYDLMTYTPAGGLAPLFATGRPGQLVGAQPSDNVLATSPQTTLSADCTVNSLVTTSSMTTVIDLGGHTLNLVSGGLLSAASITDGTLTAGGPSGTGSSELFLFANSNTIIYAGIRNAPGGGPLSLTIGGLNALQLAGTNTYTGATTIDAAQVQFSTPDAIPAGTTLNVNGGAVTFGSAITSTVQLGNVSMTDGASISSTAPVSGASWAVDSGTISAQIAGSPTITKTGTGTLTLASQGSGFSGTLYVNNGTVSLNGSLGTGTAVVGTGGRLQVTGMNTGSVVLAGGELFCQGSPPNVAGPISVTADSRLLTRPLTQNVPVLSGDVSVSAGATWSQLDLIGVSITGNFRLDGAMTGYVPDVIQIAPAAGKTISGAGNTNGHIKLTGGGLLSPGAGAVPATLSTNSADFSGAGVYAWHLSSASGSPGTNWDLLNVADLLTVSATPASPFVVRPIPVGASGGVANFDPTQPYAWPIAQANLVQSFAPTAVSIDTSSFDSTVARYGGLFSVSNAGQQLILDFTPQASQWSGGGHDGNWSNAANWNASTPSAGFTLLFATGAAGPSTLNNDLSPLTQFNGEVFASGAPSFEQDGNAITLNGNLVNNSASTQTIAMPLTLQADCTVNTAPGDMILNGGISGPHGLSKSGPGSLTLGAVNNYSGNTTIAAGTLTLADNAALASGNIVVAAGASFDVHGNLAAAANLTVNGLLTLAGNNDGSMGTSRSLGALSIGNGGVTDISPSAATSAALVLNLSSLGFTGTGGKLDLTNNALTTGGVTLQQVTTEIASGQILTSSPGLTVGYMSVTGGRLGIRATLLGDSDLDGLVNVADLANLAGNFGVTTGATWLNGDFDLNANVNVADLADLAGNFGRSVDDAGTAATTRPLAAAAATSVPEPAVFGAAVLAGAIYSQRRRRMTKVG
jgi:autotransporter-associated beta strand protein